MDKKHCPHLNGETEGYSQMKILSPFLLERKGAKEIGFLQTVVGLFLSPVWNISFNANYFMSIDSPCRKPENQPGRAVNRRRSRAAIGAAAHGHERGNF